MLYLHRAERADGLVGMLGDLVQEPLEDALAAELVCVPTRGIERWMTQQLSSRLGATPGRADGVCANIDFPFPGTLVGGALAKASGMDPDQDPWTPSRSVWPLLEVVDSSLEETWMAPLAAHLHHASPPRELRRFAAVRHIADLYDRYAVHRPEMLRAWGAGSDTGSTRPTRWQPELWRRLRNQIGTPSPAERLGDACARLRAEPDLVELPRRLSLFGLTRLPASYLDVLAALASERDVHLFLLHPSPALWERLAGVAAPRSLRRSDDPTADQTRNPLLASWGQDAREMQLVLAATGGERAENHRRTNGTAGTLLHRIQADIHADGEPSGIPLYGQADDRPVLGPEDRSVQVHACHGRARQVDVLRGTILHLLNEDPSLEPRDIIVMCPDIETYAPLIHAVFGTAHESDDESADAPADLRVRLADRSLRQTNPVLGVVAQLLDLATARVTASQVLDLASREPVRRRFLFDDDDLARLHEWVAESGIRWGLDGGGRSTFGLERLDANTWRAGVDRTLVGVTMAEDSQRLFGGVLPLDSVASGDIELAGRLAEMVDRLGGGLAALRVPKPIEGWSTAIAEAADALTASPGQSAWQREELQRLLDGLVDEATTDETVSLVALALGDVVSLLADRLRGRPTRANFRTGHLTICTLVPMRSVPHRVICLLGLDDGAFPRAVERDGDDLILADPHIGDRDARTEDRQLLLDAVLAAKDHLVITYTGRDERTNLERPPSVPVGELLDVIDRTVRRGDSSRARDHVLVHHPLQPFDDRNFTVGALIPDRSWSFDAVNLEGARALARPREPSLPFLGARLPDLDTTVVALDDLERFVRHPVGAFLRLRLGIRMARDDEDLSDELPIELDALERWSLGERLLSGLLAGASMDACVVAERARGALPPGALGSAVLNRVVPVAQRIGAAAEIPGEPDSLDVHATLPDGTAVVGTVPDIRGDVLHRASFSRLGPPDRLVTWVRLLTLGVAWPETPFEAVTIGRARDGAPQRTDVSISRLGALGPDADARQVTAAAALPVLIDLFRRGMREPLPLYCRTSAGWARGGARNGERLARRAWTSEPNGFPKEDADRQHQLVLEGVVPFDRLLEERPRPDEQGPGWDPAEESRFGRYARRLWTDLLVREKVTDQ